MENISAITIKEVWDKLCALGIVELRINDRVVWSDNAMDCMFGRKDYDNLVSDYNKRAKEALLSDRDFRVTDIKIKKVEFHHCVADIYGYYEENNEEDEE